MTFPTPKKSEDAAKPAIQTVAPAPHMDALLRILEETDKALEPMMASGLDGRTASILREIEKSGAIALQVEGDELWVDVVDRDKAVDIIDKLLDALKK